MARARLQGRCQYKTMTEGLAVDLWLTTWETDNAATIRGTFSHSLQALIPPHQEEGDEDICVCEMTFDYHLDGETAQIQQLYDDFACAVTGSCQVGTAPTGATALCDSNFGFGWE